MSNARRPDRVGLTPDEQRRRWDRIVDAILNDPGTADRADEGDGIAADVAQANEPSAIKQEERHEGTYLRAQVHHGR